MDINLVVICGRVASEPEVRTFDSGARKLRVLVTVRVDEPRKRIDVLPVTLWDPPDDLIDPGLPLSSRVWVSGSVQRRFWDGPAGRRSRIEVVAHHIARHEGVDLTVATDE